MKPEIERIFGNKLSDKVSPILENLVDICDLIEERITEPKKDVK